MTTSTINPNQPGANTPVSSAVVRGNFAAAYNDINALWAAIGGVTGVSSFNGRSGAVTLTQTDVDNALGFDPSQRMGSYFDRTPVTTPPGTPVILCASARYGYVITGMYGLKTGSGTIVLSLRINGNPVTGLDGITANTVSQDVPATGNNVVAQGNTISLVLTAAVAQNLQFTVGGVV